MRLSGRNFSLRPWKMEDAEQLSRHANNPRVAASLRDAFPHPYTLEDARSWLAALEEDPSDDVIMAIEVDAEAVGGIGLHAMKDVYRYNAELGYWLSESYWGKGIVSEAVALMLELAFTRRHWLRVFASVFENNVGSMRVLEKNGFSRESVQRAAVMKGGQRLDEHVYAILREEWESTSK
ncbi:MAG: GNAT family N-acetyltransferase [Bacteroidetes bacterium]|nr:MAG: GNAT family N-acetyltransferase [Bacteroidota bacterium]